MTDEENIENENTENRGNFIMTLLVTLVSLVFYFIYLFIVIKYIIIYHKTKKLSILWLQYLITFVINIIFTIFYLSYLLDSKGDSINILNGENSTFIILLTIFLVAYVLNVINNFIYDSIISIKIFSSLNKMININTQDVEELSLRFKNINMRFFDKKQNLLYIIIFSVINIGLIVGFEFEYNNYNNEDDTPSVLLVKNFISYILRLGSFISLIALLICLLLINYLKKKFFNKYYYNNDLFAMKIYNMFSSKIIFSSDIIIFKIISDLIINIPILIFLISNTCNTLLWIFNQIIIFSYIIIFGALNFKLDKYNEIGKIPKLVKIWFLWKYIKFSFWENNYKYCLRDNTYRYNKTEKQILKDLEIIDDTEDTDNIQINDEKDDPIISNDLKLSVFDNKIINMDHLSIRPTNTKYKYKSTLDFSTTSELYILYKLLMLYFEKNEHVYTGVQNKINEDGTPFKQLFNQQNTSKAKKRRARQTYGPIDPFKKTEFNNAIDRMSRISKLNSSNLIKSKKFNEHEIFYSLEEKELKEEFKNKFKKEKETIFKIESLEANSFFELFPFYQISIKDIKKSLIPFDNKKIYEILLNRNRNKNLNKNNIESESEDNLFYTYNSLLIMEIYDPKEFISSEDLSNFVLSYGSYIIDTIKNINFSFIPLIIGVFNIEMCDENKIVIVYRNPLFFTNFYHFNHWINFYITEGPEKLKASILQNEVLDINEIEIKNCLKMNEADYEEITNNLKKDFDFLMKINIQVYPIIHLFIADENELDAIGKNNDVNESSIIENTSMNQLNLSGLLNESDDNINNIHFLNNNKDDNIDYKTESNSLLDKEYYSMNGHDIHTIKIYFTHFFRLNCELNKQKGPDDSILLKSNHYCQYLEGQIQNYLTKTTLFEIENNDNN